MNLAYKISIIGIIVFYIICEYDARIIRNYFQSENITDKFDNFFSKNLVSFPFFLSDYEHKIDNKYILKVASRFKLNFRILLGFCAGLGITHIVSGTFS
jgi:hypothetical protein